MEESLSFVIFGSVFLHRNIMGLKRFSVNETPAEIIILAGDAPYNIIFYFM